MASVVRRNANGMDIFLNGSPHNITDGTVISQVNDFDSVTRQFEIDGNDRAIMTIAEWYGSQYANFSTLGTNVPRDICAARNHFHFDQFRSHDGVAVPPKQ